MENQSISNDMSLAEIEALGGEVLGDVEGQEAELKGEFSRQVIEAVGEFLTLGTPEELNSLIEANI